VAGGLVAGEDGGVVGGAGGVDSGTSGAEGDDSGVAGSCDGVGSLVAAGRSPASAYGRPRYAPTPSVAATATAPQPAANLAPTPDIPDPL
jgi:hypothetical protein